MEIKIALAGNPNCGKTTLFNALTGSNQFVGNWPGVDVYKRQTVIGKGATIGGNAFIVNSITEGMKVSIKNPELQFSPDLSENNQDKYWYWMI